MTQDEAEVFASAVRPALEIALPAAGRKRPFTMMFWAFVVGILGKLKARLKTGWLSKFKKKPGDPDPIDV